MSSSRSSWWTILSLSTLALGAISDTFSNPVVQRIYSGGKSSLSEAGVSISEAASALAGLKPSYVSGTLYTGYGESLTSQEIADYKTIRETVLKSSPNAKFDIEISLNPHPLGNRNPFPDADAVVALMKNISSQITVDSFWFDFYSDAQRERPAWVSAAVRYAHKQGKLIGGNVFNDTVPPGSDMVAFVDKPDSLSYYGFSIPTSEVQDLKASSSTAVILGHLNSNPQHGATTESCQYNMSWNSTRRAYYNKYWHEEQKKLGFTYMLPLYFPECPDDASFNTVNDKLKVGIYGYPAGSGTLYDYLKDLSTGHTEIIS